MRRFMAVLCLLPLTAAPSALVADDPPPLTVHEWGTFTAVAGPDGQAMVWQPLAGPDDLPDFVYTLDEMGDGVRDIPCLDKGCMGRIRMETPVIYFHTDQSMDVSVRVDFPSGTMTEWYPKVRWMNQHTLDWGTFRVDPALPADFVREPGESHYYPARNTNAAPLRVCDEQGSETERFLFYRGVGDFPLSMRATVDDQVRLEGPTGRLVVFENTGETVRWSWVDHDGTSTVERPTQPKELDVLLDELVVWLDTEGLYTDEAQAMVDTWEDSWFEPGLRVLYILPRDEVDTLLPLHVSPTPTHVERVMVGRIELMPPEVVSWSQEMTPEQRVEQFGRFAPALEAF